jgi:hypothetical protein
MTTTTWTETKAAAAVALRAAYLAEVERFAETLRSRFEAGELHGFRGEDDPGAGVRKLEAAIENHFGLATKEVRDVPAPGWVTYEADAYTAHLVLAVSPSTECADSSDGCSYNHEAQHAVEAITWDVLAIARSRRWYRATQDESPDADELARRAA